MHEDLQSYYDSVWKNKLNLPQYSTLERRWRSRWNFAKNNIADNSLVLDVACGDGVLGKFLIDEKSCDVYGLDISEYALEIARSRGIKATICDVSYDKFPFEDNYFDYEVFSCALEHIMNPHHTLSEIFRTLKPNGCVVITLPNVAYFTNRIEFLLGRTSKDFLHANPGEGMHFQFYNYNNEFENRVLSKFQNFRILNKTGDLKNPKKYSKIQRKLFKLLIKILPNLFAQYTHWLIKKSCGMMSS